MRTFIFFWAKHCSACFLRLSPWKRQTTKLTVYDDNITQSGVRCTEMTELLSHMVAAVSHEQDHACQSSLRYPRTGGLSGKGLKSFRTHPALKYILFPVYSWQIFRYPSKKWVRLECLTNLSLLTFFESKCVILTNQNKSLWPVFCTCLAGVCMIK